MAEKVFRSGLSSIYSVAHLNRIDIDFHYPLLVPDKFYEGREISFQRFAKPTLVGPEKYILGGLLGDRAGTALTAALVALFYGIVNLFQIEALVGEETLVFAGPDRQRQAVVDSLHRDPCVLQAEFFVGLRPARRCKVP